MILDYEDNLCLPDEERQQYQNELGSLRYLRIGLNFLFCIVDNAEADRYRQTQQAQAIAMEELAKTSKLGKHMRYVRHDFDFSGEDKARDLVTCAFHWYSVMACNYARLVGWLAYGGCPKEANKYTERIMPSVKVYRDKVAAHFAQTSPRDTDTPADLAISVMDTIGFVDKTFRVGALRLNVGKFSSAEMEWSLTETHRRLSARYWPGP